MPPGKPAISMAVGEPQHPIPSFVGPMIAAHVDEFGRYPMNKGLDAFGEAVAKWLNRRYALERPVDPATEVLVLNGTREGLFLAALAAKLGDAARRPAGRAYSQSVLCRVFGRRHRRRLRTGLFAGDRRVRLSARPRRAERTAAWRARSRAISLRRPIRRARWRVALISPSSRRWRGVSASWCSATNVIAKSMATGRPPECSTQPRRISPTSSCFIRYPSARACRACASASPPATVVSGGVSGTAQRRRAAGGDAGATRRHRRLRR